MKFAKYYRCTNRILPSALAFLLTKGPYDQAHEVSMLRGFEIDQVATGDYHSVVLDKLGRIFSFGDNMFGQLAFDNDVTVSTIEAPTMVNINKLYGNTGLVPKVTSIAAGGLNTFLTVDATAPCAFH